MGIQGLLPMIKEALDESAHLKQFSGKTIAVDTYCWLHRGTYSCAMDLIEGKPTRGYVNFVMKRMDLLLEFNIKPIMVFDGNYLPSKQGKEVERDEKRKQNKQEGMRLLRKGNKTLANQFFQKCVEVTPQMVYYLCTHACIYIYISVFMRMCMFMCMCMTL